jgi:hypothetical protein
MAVGGGAGLLAFALASFIPRHRPATATADTASSPRRRLRSRAAPQHQPS